MGHLFWPVTCAYMGKQLNPQPSHPGKVGVSRPPGNIYLLEVFFLTVDLSCLLLLSPRVSLHPMKLC